MKNSTRSNTTFFTLLFLSVLSIQKITAQNIKEEKIQYKYVKLPLEPLPKTIQNYQSFVVAPYEAENQKKMDQYNLDLKKAEDDYQRELQEYPNRVKEAEAKYQLEMDAWNKKSVAEKLVEKNLLNENNKPVKNIPSQPYKKSVQKPTLKTSYDYPSIANTYVVLDGYMKNPDNALKIEVTIAGFDYTPPRQVTEQKNSTSTVNGATKTTTTTYYHVEFTYRHVMSAKVFTPDGKELFFLSPQELNSYKTYKSAESTSPVAYSEESLVKMNEEKVLQENLTFISNLINDKIGFKRETRNSMITYVKNKDELYNDLMLAYNDALSSFKILVDDETTAKSKLTNAIQVWNEALKESDPNNKKARIDKGVTISIYFNLLECYFAMRDITTVDTIISTLNTMDISKSERKDKEAYELLFNDLKKRIAINK